MLKRGHPYQTKADSFLSRCTSNLLCTFWFGFPLVSLASNGLQISISSYISFIYHVFIAMRVIFTIDVDKLWIFLNMNGPSKLLVRIHNKKVSSWIGFSLLVNQHICKPWTKEITKLSKCLACNEIVFASLYLNLISSRLNKGSFE